MFQYSYDSSKVKLVLGIFSTKFCIQIVLQAAEATASLSDSRIVGKFQSWMWMQPSAQSLSRNEFLESSHQSFLDLSSFARFFANANYLIRNFFSKRKSVYSNLTSNSGKLLAAPLKLLTAPERRWYWFAHDFLQAIDLKSELPRLTFTEKDERRLELKVSLAASLVPLSSQLDEQVTQDNKLSLTKTVYSNLFAMVKSKELGKLIYSN